MHQMIFNEGIDEVITMVIAFMVAQCQRLLNTGAGCLEGFGMELFNQEFVGQSLIDQDASGERWLALVLHQRCCVILCPVVLVCAQVAGEGFLAPWALAGGGNRGEGGDAFEQLWMTQCQHQGAMPAHGVPHDADVGLVCGQAG